MVDKTIRNRDLGLRREPKKTDLGAGYAETMPECTSVDWIISAGTPVRRKEVQGWALIQHLHLKNQKLNQWKRSILEETLEYSGFGERRQHRDERYSKRNLWREHKMRRNRWTSCIEAFLQAVVVGSDCSALRKRMHGGDPSLLVLIREKKSPRVVSLSVCLYEDE